MLDLRHLGRSLPYATTEGVGVIEMPDRRFHEWLAERRHAMLSPFFSDHGQALNRGEVFDAEL